MTVIERLALGCTNRQSERQAGTVTASWVDPWAAARQALQSLGG
jgi:hypothetical protein